MKINRSREGIIVGVCQGLSDWSGISVRFIRIAAVLLAIFSWGWTLVAYIAAALIIAPRRPEGYDGGWRENLEDLRDDAEDFVKREYNNLKEAFPKHERKVKREKKVKPESHKESSEEV